MAEEECYIESKTCVVCKHFIPFMASAGICKAEEGCACERMIDCMITCRNGKFEYDGGRPEKGDTNVTLD